jgi:hypothetical protein
VQVLEERDGEGVALGVNAYRLISIAPRNCVCSIAGNEERLGRRGEDFVGRGGVDSRNLRADLEDGNDGFNKSNGLLLDEEVGRKDGASGDGREGRDLSGMRLGEELFGSHAEIVNGAGGGSTLVGVLDGVQVDSRRLVAEVVEDVDCLDSGGACSALEAEDEVDPLVQIGADVLRLESLLDREDQ